MTKIVLGKRPKSFAPMTVSVAMPEGGLGDIGVTFKYRTRDQYAEFFDGLMKEAGVEPEALPENPEAPTPDSDAALDVSEAAVQFSLMKALDKLNGKNANVIMEVVDAWDLDREFTLANVRQLCNELPGVALAVIERYRQACIEGRLGN